MNSEFLVLLLFFSLRLPVLPLSPGCRRVKTVRQLSGFVSGRLVKPSLSSTHSACIALSVTVSIYLVWVGHKRAVIPVLFHPSERLGAPLVLRRTSWLDPVTDPVSIYIAEVPNERRRSWATFMFEQTWYIWTLVWGLFWATLVFEQTWYFWTLVSVLFHPTERLGAQLVLHRIA
jgi:hypothetical protein